MITIICKECNQRYNLIDFSNQLKGTKREIKCKCGHILIPNWKPWLSPDLKTHRKLYRDMIKNLTEN
jgi:hypothetical protein